MRYLVTGGAGFIGSNLVTYLLQLGHDVTVLDNLESAGASLLNGLDVRLIDGDVRDPSAVEAAASGQEIVVHLAAFPGVVASLQDPKTCFDVNVMGTLNVLTGARDAGAQRFILASTCGALFGNSEPPFDESMPPSPMSPYGASKASAEALCRAFQGSYGLETVALRFTNVFGPNHGHKSSAIKAFLNAAAEERPVVVFGDGTQTRDFIFVADLVQAIMCAAGQPAAAGEVFHIGSGVEVSLLDLVDAVRMAVGTNNLPMEFKPARDGEVDRSLTRVDKAASVLGFQAKTTLQEGLYATWQWMHHS